MERYFRPNEVVAVPNAKTYDWGFGRVWYHDRQTQTVQVIVQTGRFSWAVKKFDELEIEPRPDYVIWGMNRPFSSEP
jgi:hypothetical protein